ncbi:COBRA-like protein 7 [Oryza glaberrima]|uniref:COBRA C-terminal domain-containing protein n=1 Tax=Oryza glaberrima TaxID=4538 RepID=I1QDG3_ORYGL|nr:COBRA-like protein 7 [Oryza glaberrima]
MAVFIIANNPLARYAVLFAAAVFLVAAAQAQPTTPPPPPPPEMDCNGILLTYNLDRRDKIRPFVAAPDADAQPYSFRATATVLNSGTRALRSWTLRLTFHHREILVQLDGAVLTSGADLPYNTTADNATSFSGYPQTDLLTPIATAGDLTKIQATLNLVGTLFAGPPPYVPLPSALSLADPSYTCPPAINVSTSTLSTCCVLTPEAAANASAGDLEAGRATSYLPRGAGDLVITYDVLQAHETTYLAQVTLENDALLGRLDGWELSWEWLRGEFISSMRGAYPRQVGATDCVYGAQGAFYKGLDFSKVLNCDRKPAVLDLPPSRRGDEDIGGIDHCCRNGTMLPKSVDAAQSKSAFQMEVYKMPPDLNRTKLYAPANFRVSGASPLNPEYACGQPVRVTPTELPDPSGLASTTLALATWQVVCNMTAAPPSKPPSCCVTFSAFYNESVIPCRTCACGCPASPAAACSTTAPSMLLPPYALLMPFERRGREAVWWAGEKRLGVPRPMPCGDSCGVSINWHVATDYAGGWSARATLFNWEGADVAEWFLAVAMEKQAYDGFEQAFTFNATAMGNGTTMILMKGREGFQYLKRESNMSGVDYPVAGKQQSVLLFTKKRSGGGIDVVGGDGFPTRVLFNGHECAMPQRIPSSAHRRRLVLLWTTLLVFMSSILLVLSLL